MPTVVALSCPVCGASLKPSAETCAYCGSYVFIKSDLPKLDRHSLNQAVIQEHIATFRRRVRADAFDEEAHYGLGLAYYNLGLLEAAEDELSQSARLMPENPHIQAQLAVVVRDQIRNGDHPSRDRLHKLIDTTLKLDSDNVEALALLAEEHALKGDVGGVESLLQRIARIDAGRVASARETAQIARIERAIERDEWMQARPLLQALSRSNVPETKRLIGCYLSRSRQDFPLRLVDPVIRERATKNAKGLTYVVGFVAVILFVGIAAATDSAIPILAALASIFLLPKFAVKKYTALVAETERASAITLDQDDLQPDRAEVGTLMGKADALHRFRQGGLLDLRRSEPLTLSASPRKERL